MLIFDHIRCCWPSNQSKADYKYKTEKIDFFIFWHHFFLVSVYFHFNNILKGSTCNDIIQNIFYFFGFILNVFFNYVDLLVCKIKNILFQRNIFFLTSYCYFKRGGITLICCFGEAEIKGINASELINKINILLVASNSTQLVHGMDGHIIFRKNNTQILFEFFVGKKRPVKQHWGKLDEYKLKEFCNRLETELEPLYKDM